MGALGGTPAGERVQALLRERSTLQDGQEDPGAVEAAGMGVELALAEEFRRVADGRGGRAAPAPGVVLPAGPASMRNPPEDWDLVDEAGDESFPASDPRASRTRVGRGA